jgi:hypothetical protein
MIRTFLTIDFGLASPGIKEIAFDGKAESKGV